MATDISHAGHVRIYNSLIALGKKRDICSLRHYDEESSGPSNAVCLHDTKAGGHLMQFAFMMPKKLDKRPSNTVCLHDV